MSRRLYLDRTPGEARGVVTLDGRPERLLIERADADRGPRLGARYRARVVQLSGDGGLAFLDLGGGEAAVLPLKRGSPLAQGALVEGEVAAERRAEKATVLRLIAPTTGAPGLVFDGPSLEAQLSAFAPEVGIVGGDEARETADEAEETALAMVHELADGLRLCIEPTRALTAVDVDWSAPGGLPARRSLKANLAAIAEAARLLRLKAIGGPVVIDLVGFPRPPEALQAAAREAFAPDGPGVTVLPVNRLGQLPIAKPHRQTPVAELLLARDGRPSARTVAQRLIRALRREAAADPGARLVGVASPEVAAELEPLIAGLGPRFALKAELGWDRLNTDIRRA